MTQLSDKTFLDPEQLWCRMGLIWVPIETYIDFAIEVRLSPFGELSRDQFANFTNSRIFKDGMARVACRGIR